MNKCPSSLNDLSWQAGFPLRSWPFWLKFCHIWSWPKRLLFKDLVQNQPSDLGEGERLMHGKVWVGAIKELTELGHPSPAWKPSRIGTVTGMFCLSSTSTEVTHFLAPPKDHGTLCDSGSSWCPAGEGWKWAPVTKVWGAGYFLVLFQNSCAWCWQWSLN